MTDPITFTSAAKNTELPFLFSGQSQKEFFLNQSLVTIDALLPRTVQGVLETPPEVASDGDCYLVGPSPLGDWMDKPDCLVIRLGEGWHFIEPGKGMEVFDQSSERKLIYLSQWYQPLAPSQPIGGVTIDVEARSAINDLIASLQSFGVIG